MSSILIKNATIINEGLTFKAELLINDEYISAIRPAGEIIIPENSQIIDARGLLLMPGVIDDQVHFR